MEQVRDRHLQYFLALAETADAGLITTESRSWVERLEHDHDNLRAAFAASHVVAGGGELRLRFTAALWRFWFMRGLLHEGQACVDEVLAESHGVSPAWAKTLYGAALLMGRLGNNQRMAALAEAAFAACRQLGDHRGMAYALTCLGWAAIEQADDHQAAARFEQSLGLFRAVQDCWGIGYVLNRLGWVLCERGEYGRAIGLFEESLALFRQMGELGGMSDALGCMASAMVAQGDYARATTLTEESLELKRANGDKYASAHAVCDLGYLAALGGDSTVARARYDESLRLSRELGYKRHTAWILTRSGHFALDERDAQRATGFFVEAMALNRELEDLVGIRRCLVGLAEVAVAQRRPERAARLLGATEVLSEARQLRMDRHDRAAYDRAVTAARSQLDEATFASAWAEGRAMVLEQAIAYVVEDPITAS
jgi:tetratricopeptide (TPR) repeat protein